MLAQESSHAAQAPLDQRQVAAALRQRGRHDGWIHGAVRGGLGRRPDGGGHHHQEQEQGVKGVQTHAPAQGGAALAPGERQQQEGGQGIFHQDVAIPQEDVMQRTDRQ